jgi:hypothetical protein
MNDMLGILLLLLALMLLGYTTSFLARSLVVRPARDNRWAAWPGPLVQATFRGLARAVVCLLAGPAELVALATYFWANSGEWTWLDSAIMCELGVAAVGYWSLALMAVARRGRLRDANPGAVVVLVKALGWRAIVTAGLLGVTVLVLGQLALAAAEEAGATLIDWFELVACFAGLLFWATLILRWLAISSYLARKVRRLSLRG